MLFCKDNHLEFKDLRKQKVLGSLLCPVHIVKSVSNHKPNACVLFRETFSGHFQQFTLCDDNLLSDDKLPTKCEFNYLYSDSRVQLPHQNVNLSGKTTFKTKAK